MADLSAELDLELNKFRNQVKRAQNISRRMERHGKQMGRRMGPAMFGSIPAAARRAATMVSGTFNQILIGGLRNIGVGITNQIGQSVKNGFKGALDRGVQREAVEMSFNALSVDNMGGGRIFEELRKDSLRTGVEVSAMFGTVRKLMAQGLGESDALKISDSLLDIGGNLGMTSEDINLIGLALSQIQGKGKAMAEEITRQLGERGIPILQALKEVRGETGAEIFKSMAAGKITADQVLNIFKDMEGPFQKFKGGAERMATTMGGLIARFKAEVSDLQLVVGQKMIPFLKPPTEWAIGKIQEMKVRVADIMDFLVSAVQTIDFTSAVALFKEGMALAWKSTINLAWKGLNGVIGGFAQMMEEVAQNWVSAFMEILKPEFWSGLGDILMGIFSSVMASLMEPLRKDPFFGHHAHKFQQALREQGNDAMSRVTDPEGPVRATVQSIWENGHARLKNMADDLSEAFQRNFDQAGNLTDSDWTTFLNQMAALKQAIKDNMQSPGTGIVPRPADKPKSPLESTQATGNRARNSIIASSLARIGGGGRVAGQDEIMKNARERLQVQKRMADYLKRMSERAPEEVGGLAIV